MCGIVGLIALGALDEKEEQKRQKFMKYASTELMLRTDERGKDATGATILFDDGNYAGIKRGEEATNWFAKFGHSEDRYGSLIKIWDEYERPVKIFLGHCRKGTVGDKEENENNHPIKIKNIIGVHNGVINNDKEIQEHLGCKRDGKVDSEMIFRLMSYFTNEGKEPWTMDMLEHLIARLTGAWAVMAFNADNIHQMPIFRDGRPVEFIFIKEMGLLIVVSDIKFWSSFHFQYERTLFYGRLKSWPSLLQMNIEKETMADDSAVIIDLDINCTKDTKLKDIYEWRKIPRNNKIWTSNAALNKRSNFGVGAYSGGQTAKVEPTKVRTTESTTKDVSKDTVVVPATGDKKRIFNETTRRFEIRQVDHPKTLKDNESASLPIDNSEEAEDHSNVNDKEDKKDKSTFMNDIETQAATTNTLEIEDHTDYKSNAGETAQFPVLMCGSEEQVMHKKKHEKHKDDVSIIDVEAEIIEDEKVSITEVDMSVDNVELMALANKAYNNLPTEDRGYSDVDPLLKDINIVSEARANELGIKLVSNRVACVQWVRGFMHGWLHRDKDLKPDENKTKVREKHISNLKSLVVILASYFSRSKDVKNHPFVKKDLLVDVAREHLSKRPSFNMDDVKKIFNDHESGKIEEANEVIKCVAQKVNSK